MKAQKITDKPQQESVTTFWEIPLDLSEKAIFDHKPTPVTWFRLFKHQTTE